MFQQLSLLYLISFIGYLWDNVRVVGGAYGGFASYSGLSGRMNFISYRDPNLAKTIQVYNGIADYLDEDFPEAEDITEAIIGTVGDLDSPQSPDQKGK